MDGGRRGRRLNPCSRKLNSELDPFYLRNPSTAKRRVVFLATSVCVCVLDPPKTHTRLFSAKKGNETARFGNKFNVTKRGLFCGCFFFIPGVNCWRELIKKCWLENCTLITVNILQSFALLIEEHSAWCILLRGLLYSPQHIRASIDFLFFIFFGFAFALMKCITLRSPKYLKLKLIALKWCTRLASMYAYSWCKLWK